MQISNSDITNLEEAVKKAREQKNFFEGEALRQQGIIAALLEETKNRTVYLDDLNKRVKEKAVTEQSLEQSITELKDVKAMLDTEYATVQEQVTSCRNEVTQTRIEVAQSQKETEAKKAELETLSNQISDKHSNVTQLQLEVETKAEKIRNFAKEL